MKRATVCCFDCGIARLSLSNIRILRSFYVKAFSIFEVAYLKDKPYRLVIIFIFLVGYFFNVNLKNLKINLFMFL